MEINFFAKKKFHILSDFFLVLVLGDFSLPTFFIFSCCWIVIYSWEKMSEKKSTNHKLNDYNLRWKGKRLILLVDFKKRKICWFSHTISLSPTLIKSNLSLYGIQSIKMIPKRNWFCPFFKKKKFPSFAHTSLTLQTALSFQTPISHTDQ